MLGLEKLGIADTVDTAFIAVSTQVTTSKRIHDDLRLVCVQLHIISSQFLRIFFLLLFSQQIQVSKNTEQLEYR